MAQVYNLVTDQELHAFADGEVNSGRLGAVVNKVRSDLRAARQLSMVCSVNEALQAGRSSVYRDARLKRAIDEILSATSRAPANQRHAIRF